VHAPDPVDRGDATVAVMRTRLPRHLRNAVALVASFFILAVG
jgi:hypothetical protein